MGIEVGQKKLMQRKERKRGAAVCSRVVSEYKEKVRVIAEE